MNMYSISILSVIISQESNFTFIASLEFILDYFYSRKLYNQNIQDRFFFHVR